MKGFDLLRVLAMLLLVLVLAQFLPMILSGDWSWPEAWYSAIAAILAFGISRGIAGRRHSDLIAERAQFMQAKDTRPWDRVLAPLLAVLWMLVMAAAGLDRAYHGPQGFPLPVKILAGLLVAAGYWVSSAALVENRFFSGTVRIQRERGHEVVSTGPYRFVRHPGYAGGLLVYLSTPLLLDSVWTLLPALLLAFVLILRTALEDRTLQAELPGYREYAARTRYRLLPGVW